MLAATITAVTQCLCWALLSLLLFIVQRVRFLIKRVREWATRTQDVSVEKGKRPEALKCMSLVIAQKEIDSYERSVIMELIPWCLQLGIEYLFVFDPTGRLKSEHDRLIESIREANPELRFETRAGWTTPEAHPLRGVGQKVHFLDRTDAVSPILHVASSGGRSGDDSQEFRGLKDVEAYWSTDLTPDTLRSQIVESFGEAAVLEPEVVCIAGPVFTLASSPLWHARFSEIYYLGPLEGLHFEHFTSILSQFWNTHQRFGA